MRPATLGDADRLLAWRNDPAVRAASHSTGPVEAAGHRRWLERILADADRQLFIAEEDGVPVGSVRADADSGAGGGKLLSWTVAPEARGRGVGKRMLAALLACLPGPVRAEVKVGNPASARIAAAAGLILDREAGGVLHFVRAEARTS